MKILFPSRGCIVWRLLLAVVTALGTLTSNQSHSAPKEGCEYPHLFGPTLAKPAHRAGEFRITLLPPDYRSAKSIQGHFVFSTVFAALLRSELIAQTDYRCRAVISSSFFPDLRVFLIENRPDGAAQIEPSPCISALQDVLLKGMPNSATVNKTALAEASQRRLTAVNDAAFILRHTLAKVYLDDSIMHALVTIEPEAFETLNVDDFLAWLQRERSSGEVGLRPLRFCTPSIDPASPIDTGAEKLPYSETIPSSALEIQIKSDKAAPSISLQHVVVVGEGPAVAFSRSPRPAIQKYCNQPLVPPIDSQNDSTPPSMVRIRCLRSVQFNDAWTVFYCDPSDCTSQRQAHAVAKQIAEYEEIVSLAKETAWHGQTRGPYLVNVNLSGR